MARCGCNDRYTAYCGRSSRHAVRLLRVDSGRSSVESSDGCTLDPALCISKISPPGRTASAPQEVGNHIKLLAFFMALLKIELSKYMIIQIVMLAMRSRPGRRLPAPGVKESSGPSGYGNRFGGRRLTDCRNLLLRGESARSYCRSFPRAAQSSDRDVRPGR